jgi:hypothetical protein
MGNSAVSDPLESSEITPPSCGLPPSGGVVTSGCGSLGIRRISFQKGFGCNSGSVGLLQGWSRKFDLVVGLCSCLAPMCQLCVSQQLTTIAPDLWPETEWGRRCWESTAVPAGLPQSARCQVAWHLSIQTVARLPRSSLRQARVADDKPLNYRLLSIFAESARLLLSGVELPAAALNLSG